MEEVEVEGTKLDLSGKEFSGWPWILRWAAKMTSRVKDGGPVGEWIIGLKSGQEFICHRVEVFNMGDDGFSWVTVQLSETNARGPGNNIKSPSGNMMSVAPWVELKVSEIAWVFGAPD